MGVVRTFNRRFVTKIFVQRTKNAEGTYKCSLFAILVIVSFIVSVFLFKPRFFVTTRYNS